MKAKKNFSSCVSSDTALDPHELYICLATDAVLLHFNDELPNLSDEENQRLLDAAHYAAQAVLRLAQVPTDWIAFQEALSFDYETTLRSDLHAIIYDLMRPINPVLSEEEGKALERIRKNVAPANYGQLHEAVQDYELANWRLISDGIEDGFKLGFQIAFDPRPILYEKALAKHIDDMEN